MAEGTFGLGDPILEIAMEMIVEAGEARISVGEAIAKMEQGDFPGAEEKLSTARVQLAAAHSKQTNLIQSEGESGAARAYPLLFIHAQDTIMTIQSELNLCRRLSGLFRRYEERLSALEAGRGATGHA